MTEQELKARIKELETKVNKLEHQIKSSVARAQLVLDRSSAKLQGGQRSRAELSRHSGSRDAATQWLQSLGISPKKSRPRWKGFTKWG